MAGSQKKSEIKEKMNSLKIENMRKLRVIVNGESRCLFLLFFLRNIKNQASAKKTIGRKLIEHDLKTNTGELRVKNNN
ncbi:MAG: hypothetical protein WDM90_08400 [Ferruginibacter sp.]